MNKTELKNTIRSQKIIAVARGIEKDDILLLAEALVRGGIGCMEITLDRKSPDGDLNALKSIAALCDRFGETMQIGVGTVLSADRVRDAAVAGAKFVVSPNVSGSVINESLKQGLISIPGALTPSEIVCAYESGADFVKVFPASVMGADYFKAVSAPLSHIPLLAFGGIRPETVSSYLKAGVCGFGVGGDLTNKEWIKNGRFDLITTEAERYRKAVYDI